MKKSVLVILITGILLLGACNTPATIPTPIQTPMETPVTNSVFLIKILSNAEEFAINMGETTYLPVSFSGSILIMEVDGDSLSRSVEGETPTVKHGIPSTTTYEVKGYIVSAVFQKQEASHRTLIVEIWRDGKLIVENSTSAAYGVVSVVTK